MANSSKHEILVVDDDNAVRDSLAMLLKSAGYGVRSSIHGFDALLQLRRALPAVIISELDMPRMTGFEFLSVVRRRFPKISVIAMSGAYASREDVPGGVIADAFHAKGYGSRKILLRTVAELIQTSAAHALDHERESAPACLTPIGKDSAGIPYVMLTCTDCLRSFPLSMPAEDLHKLHETPCLFCFNIVRYLIDFSLSIASPWIPEKEAGKHLPVLDVKHTVRGIEPAVLRLTRPICEPTGVRPPIGKKLLACSAMR
jgi:CheY-like chemotaxis protein